MRDGRRINPELIEARRSFRLAGYATLADVGMDGDYVTPLQIGACSPTGPVLLAHHWSSPETALKEYERIRPLGYLPGIPFNDVIDLALRMCGLERNDVYMTQAFHLLPPRMCFRIPAEHMRRSFDLITREELSGRRVIALGKAAATACRRNKLTPDRTVCHPSARGWTVEARATKLAEAIAAVAQDAAPAPADPRVEQARRFQREARNTGIDSSELLRQFRDERALRCRE